MIPIDWCTKYVRPENGMKIYLILAIAANFGSIFVSDPLPQQFICTILHSKVNEC